MVSAVPAQRYVTPDDSTSRSDPLRPMFLRAKLALAGHFDHAVTFSEARHG
jgi:hypothetical protein